MNFIILKNSQLPLIEEDLKIGMEKIVLNMLQKQMKISTIIETIGLLFIRRETQKATRKIQALKKIYQEI